MPGVAELDLRRWARGIGRVVENHFAARTKGTESQERIRRDK